MPRATAHHHVPVQVVRGWPNVVRGSTVLETFVGLIRRAERLIYIENQYAFQAWPLVATVLHALASKPSLRVIVIAPLEADLPRGQLGAFLDAAQEHSASLFPIFVIRTLTLFVCVLNCVIGSVRASTSSV